MHALVRPVSYFLRGCVWQRRREGEGESRTGCVLEEGEESGPCWGRKNKSLHFDGSSLKPHQLHLPTLNSWSLTAAAAAATVPARLSNSSLDVHFPAEREMKKGMGGERKSEMEGGGEGKQRGKKTLADTGHNLIFTVPGQLYRVICHGMPLKLQCLYWPRRETQTVESLLKRSGDLSRFMSLS